jgi:hypothetical protein
LRPTKALNKRLLWGWFLVALLPSKKLFVRAKHLFIAAMNGNFLGGLSRAVAHLSGLTAGQLEDSDHARPHGRLQSLWPEMLFDGGAIKPVAFHIGLADPLLADATAAQGD